MMVSEASLNAFLHLQCRRLFLRNYEVQMRIGAYEHEKQAPQRIRLNVDMYVLLQDSTPLDDQMHEVVDYDLIRRTIEARMQRGHIELQETLCDDVAATLLEHPKVQAVRVSSEKPDIYPDCEAVGVETFRFRPGVVPT
ncbi:MAG: dihydroneopterin aldolase [Brachymonas sp.]|nr:dihydroneopterin aldolase [Brachymonas sp.]